MLFKTHSLDWLGDHYRQIYGLLFGLFISLSVSAKPEIPELASDSQLATAGYYQLSWHLGVDGASLKNPQFLLQQAKTQDFAEAKTIYHGNDLSTVISGMPDGQYFYRLRANSDEGHQSPWSTTLMVEVKHHSISKAIAFFISGALVFLATLVFILRHASSTSRD